MGLVLLKNVGDLELHKEFIEAGIKSGNKKFLYDLYESIKTTYPFEPVIRVTLPDYYYNQAIKHKKIARHKTALLEMEMVKILKPQYKDVDAQIKELRAKVK